MHSDLDHLMTERSVDALVVPMHEAMHPAFRWLTRGARLTRGYAVKLAGREPLLIHYPMERDEAAASGMETRSIHDFDYDRIFKENADIAAGYAEFFDRVLRDLGGAGDTIAFEGNLPFQLYLDVSADLAKRGWRVHHARGENLVQLARKRKAPWEIEAIASVGARTEQVVDGVRGILRESKVAADFVVHGGRRLRLGDLKGFVSAEIARLGMVEEHDTILSQGRDAGVPHSRGDAEAFVRPGVPIVMDIFPADRASGYFFDLTRTFCVGDISEKLARIHADVLGAFELAAAEMKAGTRASVYQNLICDYFEARGYLTTRSNPTATSGYVHSLGHGVGLDVHEKPFFNISPLNRDMIEVGDVVTIEPGLYLPDEEIGVRIEDTLWVDADESVKTFCRSGRGLEP
jgi:Xaa-Pro aminopeptidase